MAQQGDSHARSVPGGGRTAGRHEAPAEFAYSTVDADGDTVVPKRQSFTLMRVNDGDRTGWLITQ